MMKNLSASIKQRLLNHAKMEGLQFDEVLKNDGIERVLYRLSISRHASQFVLKGVQILRVWGGNTYRPTRDVDLLGYTSNRLENLTDIVHSLLNNPFPKFGNIIQPLFRSSEKNVFSLPNFGRPGRSLFFLSQQILIGEVGGFQQGFCTPGVFHSQSFQCGPDRFIGLPGSLQSGCGPRVGCPYNGVRTGSGLIFEEDHPMRPQNPPQDVSPRLVVGGKGDPSFENGIFCVHVYGDSRTPHDDTEDIHQENSISGHGDIPMLRLSRHRASSGENERAQRDQNGF